jgi:glycosyltransferase involved in cell wall biosynthesis
VIRALEPAIPHSGRLRVALIAGGLWKGGAEKQLCYMARALAERGAEVRVFTLSGGGYYERSLAAQGLPVVWVGRREHPMLRLVRLAREFLRFRPHVVQAGHFYVNLYPAILARWFDAVAVGAVRNDVVHELRENGRWGPWLLRAPAGLLVNSQAARAHAERLGVAANRVGVLSNVIDLAEVEAGAVERGRVDDDVVVVGVSRLVAMKRIDRFLTALATARQAGVPLRGRVVGDGPEREHLVETAHGLGLLPDGVTFTGHRDDVGPELARADIFLHASDHEGFPNVLLEAMAAGLPVVTTPAGDAAVVVEHGTTGYVVPFEERGAMASRLGELAQSSELRLRLGAAGRDRARRLYGYADLGERLLHAYAAFAQQQRRRRPAAAIASALRSGAGRNEGVGPPP